MLSDVRHRFHPRGVLFIAMERTFLSNSVSITLLALLILFVCIYLRLV